MDKYTDSERTRRLKAEYVEFAVREGTELIRKIGQLEHGAEDLRAVIQVQGEAFLTLLHGTEPERQKTIWDRLERAFRDMVARDEDLKAQHKLTETPTHEFLHRTIKEIGAVWIDNHSEEG